MIAVITVLPAVIPIVPAAAAVLGFLVDLHFPYDCGNYGITGGNTASTGGGGGGTRTSS